VALISTCIVGNFNREYYNWIKPYFNKFIKSVEFLIPQNLRDNLPPITEWDDDILYNLIEVAYVSDSPKNFTYQNKTTPFIDSNISNISLLNKNIQKSIFTLIRDLSFLNGDVNQVWFYHSKTFDNLTENNLTILKANISNLYPRIARRAKIMVDQIEELKKELMIT